MSRSSRLIALAQSLGADYKKLSNRIDAVPNYHPRQMMKGPVTVSPDNPTVTTGTAPDGTFNESYVVGASALPTPWPVEAFGNLTIASSTWGGKTNDPNIATVTTYRVMADGPEVVIFCQANTFLMDLYVDGRPYASNPITLGVSTGYSPYGFQKLVFPSAKPEGRLLEFRMVGGIAAIYTKKPYRLWKPAWDINPTIAVVGDSWVAPTVMNDAAAGNVTSGYYLRGAYQRMIARLGIPHLVTDGLGGSGYLAGGGANKPYSHASRVAWLNTVAADVEIIHGGGANDLYNSFPIADIQDAIVAYFTARRAARPKAKLVFVEGFAPPGFTPATYNPNYTAIRQNVQTRLNAAGVGVYYLDVASTRPPISGSGYVTAANGSGNSDIYVGSDSYHLTVAGNSFVGGFLAPKIVRVLADKGDLVGTLF